MAARAMPAFVGPEALGLAVGLAFLVNGPPDDPGPPMTMVLNWAAGIK
jgi:hypothetical protein